MPGQVRLVDLDVIKRYSLAVRQEWVPAEELLAVLDATRDEVRASIAGAPNPPPSPTRQRTRSRRRAAAGGDDPG